METVFASAEESERERAKSAMLRKLDAGPCYFRDLLRRYSVQKRDIHEPVLAELVNEGLVSLNAEGLLELSSQGRKQLAA